MFETVIPEAVVRRHRTGFLYETLPVSLALHAIAAGAVVASMIWTVEFPPQPPGMVTSYQLAAAPPPPPPPPPPPKGAPATVPTKTPIEQPIVAPTVIPDAIPEVAATPAATSPGVPGGVEGGVEGGEVGGVVGGVIGGVVAEQAAPPPPPPASDPKVVEIPRDADLPLVPIDRGYPEYPAVAQMKGYEDTVIVRYVIGTDGRVTDVKVLQPAEREVFTRTTVKRLRQWRFRPYRDPNGVTKEVVHELTVQFRLIGKK